MSAFPPAASSAEATWAMSGIARSGVASDPDLKRPTPYSLLVARLPSRLKP